PAPVVASGQSNREAGGLAASLADRLPITIVRPCSVIGPSDRGFFPLFRLANRGLILYPPIADHWASVIHVDDVVDGLLAASKRDTSICRIYFLAPRDAVQWRTIGAHIAAAAGRSVRHVDLPGSLVTAASVAGEWIGRLTRTTIMANRSRSALARHPY